MSAKHTKTPVERWVTQWQAFLTLMLIIALIVSAYFVGRATGVYDTCHAAPIPYKVANSDLCRVS